TCRLWTRRLCDRRLRSWRCMVAPDPHHVSTGWRGRRCGRHPGWSYYDRRFCWRRWQAKDLLQPRTAILEAEESGTALTGICNIILLANQLGSTTWTASGL